MYCALQDLRRSLSYLKIKNAWPARHEHIFDPKRKRKSKIDQKENSGRRKSGINKENPKLRNGNAKLGSHSGENAKPLPFHVMPKICKHIVLNNDVKLINF